VHFFNHRRNWQKIDSRRQPLAAWWYSQVRVQQIT
jgi:hypothetical protein